MIWVKVEFGDCWNAKNVLCGCAMCERRHSSISTSRSGCGSSYSRGRGWFTGAPAQTSATRGTARDSADSKPLVVSFESCKGSRSATLFGEIQNGTGMFL